MARPYVAYLCLYLPILISGIHSILTKKTYDAAISWFNGTILVSLPLGYLFISFWLFRISLKDGMLIDSGLLKFTKRAPLKAVKRWGYEVGWPDQRWLWKPALRPFRRVALYYDDDQGRPQHFDISLNHFRAEDTYAFIQAIAHARPDLAWPKDFPRKSPGQGKRKSG